MSDSTQGQDEVEGSKHGSARQMVEAADRALAEGDDTRAGDLMDQALRTDPDGVADALAQDNDAPPLPDDAGTASDEEVAAISRTMQPHADAPSRAGIEE